jgi:hypothetical protein
MIARLETLIVKVISTVRDVIYGMTVYDWVLELKKAMLRIIPYLVPSIENWRRSMLRERDFTDLIDQEIG